MRSPRYNEMSSAATSRRTPLASLSNRQWDSSDQYHFDVAVSVKDAVIPTQNSQVPGVFERQGVPIIDWNAQHHSKYDYLLKVAASTHFKDNGCNSPSHKSPTSEWNIPIQCNYVDMTGMNQHIFLRKNYVTSAQMETKILPSNVRNISPSKQQASPRYSPNSSKSFFKPSRIWCATFCIPFSDSFGASFFKLFPQKNKVSVIIGRHKKADCLVFVVLSSELHSLGTIVRKIQNKSLTLSKMVDVRFEELEGRISMLLSRSNGSFKMTTIRPSFEAHFKTALVPSLFGVRWIKELMNLLVNSVKLKPLPDDMLVEFADKDSIRYAVHERRDIAAKVHRSMHMQVFPDETLTKLKLLTLSFLNPLLRSNIETSAFFDNEFGQVLAVLETYGLLQSFVTMVILECDNDMALDRSPVAWLDGVARRIIKGFITDGLIAPSSPDTVVSLGEILPALNTIDEGVESAPALLIPDVDDTVSSAPQRDKRQLGAIGCNLKRQKKPVTECSGTCLTWSTIPESLGILELNFNATPAKEQEVRLQHYSLFTASPFLEQINSAFYSEWEDAEAELVPVNLSSTFRAVTYQEEGDEDAEECSRETFNQFLLDQSVLSAATAHVFDTADQSVEETNTVLTPKKEADTVYADIDNVSKMLALGQDACNLLKEANIDDVQTLLLLEGNDFNRMNLKMGPLVRLRAWVQSIRP